MHEIGAITQAYPLSMPDLTEAGRSAGLRVRTVFISDIHLGTAGCQACPLLEFLRDFPSGNLYLVGDIVDGWQLRLAYLGDYAYEFTLRLNRHLNRLRARMGLPYWSLSAYLKQRVKKALNYVMNFEMAVAHEARSRGHDGVVCGHIHRAEMRDIQGILYCNDGDWVESRTALVEHFDGRLELLHWDAVCEAQTKAVSP